MQQYQSDAFERALNHGRRLAFCERDEEVVITGMAGCFPNSDNITHLRENLWAKKDLTSDNEGRWKGTTKIFKEFLIINTGTPDK